MGNLRDGVALSKKKEYLFSLKWCKMCVVYPKTYFERTISLQFEGIVVDAPKEYDKVLRIVYGDYMELPPQEEQHPTHGYQIFRKV